MSQHARIEEVSDSDPEEMDPSELEPNEVMRQSSLMKPSEIPFPNQNQPSAPRVPTGPSREQTKRWHCLYPIYFDATRTRADGRQVSKDQAVPNPLAREICDAVYGLGLQLAFEAEKTHPKDWANPGRVRVLLKQDGNPMSRSVPNKHALYIKVAAHLKANPANEETPLRLPIAGIPRKTLPPPAIPRGWKMNSILPLHSNAVSGGGVSENMFQSLMGANSPNSEGDAASGAGKAKKDKKKVKG